MKLCFDESRIQYWANRYEKEDLGELEKELMGMRCQVQQDGYLTQEALKKVVKWLRVRDYGRIEKNNDDDIIRDITSQAFTTIDEDESLIVLRRLVRVGPTIGSAILHLFHKDEYPMYTSPALESVGKRKGRGVWRPYVKYCRESCSSKQRKYANSGSCPL